MLLSLADVLLSSDPTSTFTVIPKLVASALGASFCQVRGKGPLQDKKELAPIDCWRGRGAEEAPELVHHMYM